jgi:hypothetical protein
MECLACEERNVLSDVLGELGIGYRSRGRRERLIVFGGWKLVIEDAELGQRLEFGWWEDNEVVDATIGLEAVSL